MIEISYNLNYQLSHLENLLLPLFRKHYDNDSLRVTIESANYIWCAYENHQCVGCALMTDIGSYDGLYIILFGVSESLQRRGLGTQYDNESAIKLYEKAGFQKQFDHPDYMKELPQFDYNVLPMLLLIK
ncbi:unnamed protein product [Rotaria magnacalcarata]|uniref:N-acetyltransferase domain-containing protein n=1 Tax=Rotaria magnacalcarata TaxID=392030 RepID=A0A816BX67_9BILA|nr:unnamed protein product [Rotaria magnacalcarata]CAF1617190.1 unnamed protein product [Rotaria magnacalcarata]CAF2066909.1 unnamed protein product [Rotaria magnacalcarata]